VTTLTKLYESLAYFPFGETWIDRGPQTQRIPYRYTAKELDQDTQLYYYGARYYDPRTSVWESADPALGRYLPSAGSSDPNKLAGMGGIYNPFNFAMYTYAHQNPVKFSDPDGRAVGVDDLVGGVVGGSLGLIVQGWKDIFTLSGTYGESAGAFTSGAVYGVAAVNMPETAGVSMTAAVGGVAAMAGNAVRQGVDKGWHHIDMKKVAVHGVLGAMLGGVLHKIIPDTKIPGLSSGRNSMLAIAKGVKTKMAKGIVRTMSALTAAKAVVGTMAADFYRGIVGDTMENHTAHVLHHTNP